MAHHDEHASSHSKDAADEVFVENLGAIATDTSLLLKPDGSGGTTFGNMTVQSNESVAQSTYTGDNSYQTKTSLTIGAGTWLIFWDAQLSGNDTSTEYRARIYDGSDQLDLAQVVINVVTDDYPKVSGSKKVVLTGSTTISLQYGTTDGSKIVGIKNAHIHAWKVA